MTDRAAYTADRILKLYAKRILTCYRGNMWIKSAAHIGRTLDVLPVFPGVALTRHQVLCVGWLVKAAPYKMPELAVELDLDLAPLRPEKMVPARAVKGGDPGSPFKHLAAGHDGIVCSVFIGLRGSYQSPDPADLAKILAILDARLSWLPNMTTLSTNWSVCS